MKLKYKDTNKTYSQILVSEARRFTNILQKYIDKFYLDYDPVVYERTYGLYNSIYPEDIADVEINDSQIIIKIKRDEGSFGQSMFNDSNVDLMWLLNDGYKVKKNVWFSNIEYFGYRDGFHFIEKAVNEFKRTNKYNLSIEVHRPLIYYG